MKVEKEPMGPTDSTCIVADRKGSLKVTITPAQHKTLTHLPKRPPVDLAFNDLTYRVQEGRKNSEYCLLLIYLQLSKEPSTFGSMTNQGESFTFNLKFLVSGHCLFIKDSETVFGESSLNIAYWTLYAV